MSFKLLAFEYDQQLKLFEQRNSPLLAALLIHLGWLTTNGCNSNRVQEEVVVSIQTLYVRNSLYYFIIIVYYYKL